MTRPHPDFQWAVDLARDLHHISQHRDLHARPNAALTIHWRDPNGTLCSVEHDPHTRASRLTCGARTLTLPRTLIEA